MRPRPAPTEEHLVADATTVEIILRKHFKPWDLRRRMRVETEPDSILNDDFVQ